MKLSFLFAYPAPTGEPDDIGTSSMRIIQDCFRELEQEISNNGLYKINSLELSAQRFPAASDFQTYLLQWLEQAGNEELIWFHFWGHGAKSATTDGDPHGVQIHSDQWLTDDFWESEWIPIIKERKMYCVLSFDTCFGDGQGGQHLFPQPGNVKRIAHEFTVFTTENADAWALIRMGTGARLTNSAVPLDGDFSRIVMHTLRRFDGMESIDKLMFDILLQRSSETAVKIYNPQHLSKILT